MIQKAKTYLRDRFYLRGTTWLGLLNTALAFVLNRVLVRCVDSSGDTVLWRMGRGTDFPKESQ